jgi:cell division septal protein FtsQ
VRRRLPDQLSIEIVEREPVALVRMGELFLIDGEGAVFKELEEGDPSDLPIITGITRERFEGDRGGARADLAEALALLRLYEESGLTREHPLSEVHVEQDGSLSLYTLEGATHVRLGRPPFRRKLRRLARLMRELHSQEAVADYVYLEEGDGQVQPDRAVVRLRP